MTKKFIITESLIGRIMNEAVCIMAEKDRDDMFSKLNNLPLAPDCPRTDCVNYDYCKEHDEQMEIGRRKGFKNCGYRSAVLESLKAEIESRPPDTGEISFQSWVLSLIDKMQKTEDRGSKGAK